MNKQIEEMAKILTQADENSYKHCARTKSCNECKYHTGKFPCPKNFTAEELYNADYRRVNDDKVVISKAEYEKLKSNETLCEAIRADKKLEVETTSKETAMDILQKIAYESEYAYCNRSTKWFEKFAKNTT